MLLALAFLFVSLLPPEFGTEGSVIILDQEVEIIDLNTGGVPLAFTTLEGMGVNYDFLALPYWAQEALIAHELGHVNLGHFNLDPLVDRDAYYILWGTVDPWERDADLYAADMVGGGVVIAMLEHANSLCTKIMALPCMQETVIRIDMLQEQQCEMGFHDD